MATNAVEGPCFANLEYLGNARFDCGPEHRRSKGSAQRGSGTCFQKSAPGDIPAALITTGRVQ